MSKSSNGMVACKPSNPKLTRIKSAERSRKLTIDEGDGNVMSQSGIVIDRIPPGMYRWDRRMGGMMFTKVIPAEDTFEPTAVQQTIISQISQWIQSRDSYHAHGLGWKRGWLMHGKPGCGKTALMRMISKQAIALGAIVLEARYLHELTDAIDHALASVQGTNAPVIILMEDIDHMGDSTELTEFLDGIGSNDGLAFVASTNYLEELSDRVLRDGRFDERIKLEPPSFEDKCRYLDMFNIKSKKKEIAKLSMAELREFVIKSSVLVKQ